MAKRIALSGKPLSGKSTLARLMKERYGYRHASLSDLIVQRYAEALNEPWMVTMRGGQRIEVSDIYANKELYREGLQIVGDELGFQDPNRIVALMQEALVACGAWDHPDEPVVVEAIRGELQASAARALGFGAMVDLWIDEGTQRQRAGSEEAYQRARQSMRARPDLESGVDSAGIRLTPAMSLEDAATLLYILPEGGLSRGPANQPFAPGSLADWASIS